MAGADVERGLRFIHLMEVETRTELSQNSVDVTALADLLIAKGIISSRELDERKRATIPLQNERDHKRRLPLVGPGGDKYALASPDVPCVENLALCRGACCSLVFNLGIQDLDEGVIKWEYGQPYRIRREHGRCVHFDVERKGCGAYQHRPATCRTYDCRQDKRIWADYDKRIPAPDLDKLAPPLPASG